MRKAVSRILILVLLAASLMPAVFAGAGGTVPPREIAEGYQLVKTSVYYYEPDGTEHASMQISFAYEFDERGHVARRTDTITMPSHLDAEPYTEIHEYQYDADGNCIKDAIISEDGMNYLLVTWYTYENGLLILEEHGNIINNKKEVYNSTTNTYDSAGKLTKSSSAGYLHIYTYDKNGELSSEKGTIAPGEGWEIQYTRKDGELIAREYYNGISQSQTVYSYDSAGNNIKASTYFKPDESTLRLESKTVYEFAQLGPQRSGWTQDGSGWYYYENGKPVTGWKQVDGTWYYMNNSGIMQTGWVSVDGTWYYMNSSGAMQTGWLDDGAWYYLNDSGSMATGWVSVNGTWYYMNNSGAMQTGWLNDNGTWYYLYDSGSMATGWLNDGGTWYYLNTSGAWIA